MRYPLLAAILSIVSHGAFAAPSDVPANHWAASSVAVVTGRGVMDAPNGKFDGGRKVSREELANVLARFAQALEKGGWQPATPSPTTRKQPDGSAWESAPVNRYELAALLDRTARNVLQGLPKPTGKTFGETEAIPAAALDKIPKTSPAYNSLTYLAKNHMVWGNSVLLKPSAASVTGKEVVVAVAMVITGLNDRLTDEPQNREDLGPPPSHQHDKK